MKRIPSNDHQDFLPHFKLNVKEKKETVEGITNGSDKYEFVA